jgi:hypothetical protein
MNIYLVLLAGVFALASLVIVILWHRSPEQTAAREARRLAEERLGRHLQALLDDPLD